jgi:hypothetical protein
LIKLSGLKWKGRFTFNYKVLAEEVASLKVMAAEEVGWENLGLQNFKH